MVTFIVYHKLNQPANAVENCLLWGLTFYLVGESAELALGSGVLSKEEARPRGIGESKISKGQWVLSLWVLS